MTDNQLSWALWFYDKAYWLSGVVLLFELLARPKIPAILCRLSARYRSRQAEHRRELEAAAERLLANPAELEGFYQDYERRFLASNRWDSITFVIFGLAVILRFILRGGAAESGGFAFSIPGLVLLTALISTVKSNREWYKFLRFREVSQLLKQRIENNQP